MKKRRKLKNVILKGITAFAGINCAFWGCAIDSESMIPFWICLICSGWLLLFAYANFEWGGSAYQRKLRKGGNNG